MAVNTDMVTTFVGASGAAVMAAQPIVAAFTPGQPVNWAQLAFAVIFGIMGYFTNKNKPGTK